MHNGEYRRELYRDPGVSDPHIRRVDYNLSRTACTETSPRFPTTPVQRQLNISEKLQKQYNIFANKYQG